MAEFTEVLGPGLHPDSIWRNYDYLRKRVEALEAKVRELEARIVPGKVE